MGSPALLPGVIIVLGSTNTKKGVLSPIAKSRAAKAYEFWTSHKDYKFLLTGGFGSHFNQTHKPHGAYMRDYLVSLGLPPAQVMGSVDSFNTIEDAFLSAVALEGLNIKEVVVSTSDFHIPRARLIFEKIFPQQVVKFLSSLPPVTALQKEKLESHETLSIRRLLKAQGLKNREK